MAGGGGEQLLQCFRESSSNILMLSEIQQWWRERGSGEEQLQELLQEQVENGTVGCRVLTVGGSQYTVHWLKEQRAAGLSSTPPCSPSQPQKGATPMSSSLRERLKRSRPRFVSPLLSSAKKPRLTVAASVRPPVGKLDFADCDHSLSDVTEELKGQRMKRICRGSPEDGSDCTERISSMTAEDFRVCSGEGSGVCSGEGSGVCSGEGSGVCSGEGSGVCSGEGSGVCSGEGSGVCSSEGRGRVCSSEGSGVCSGEGRGRVCSGEGSKVCSGEGSGVCSGEGSEVCSGEGSGVCSGEGSGVLLVAEKASLERQLREEEERLRKLRMVKMYRTKNDLGQLDTLIHKWREAAQEAAETLLASSTLQPRPSMAQLLDYLHIDHTIIHYSTEDEAFY